MISNDTIVCQLVFHMMPRYSYARVSVATTIMISSLLKDSSGGFVRCIRTNDYENHIQDTNLTIVMEIIQKELQDKLGRYSCIRSECSNHYHDFIPAKGLFRWLCSLYP